MRKLFYCLIFFLTACSIESYDSRGVAVKNDVVCRQTTTGYVYKNYTIKFISEPEGAVIELNNNYIGRTPCSYTFSGRIGMLAEGFTVVATPNVAGQYTQTKVLNNPIPSTVYFNMSLVPSKSNYNVIINE